MINFLDQHGSLIQTPRPNAIAKAGFLTKCGRNCITCKHLTTQAEIKSYVTKHRYIGLTKGDIITCQQKGVVYCITCNHCGIQYVGMTTRAINERFREHIYFAKDTQNKKGNYLYDHFNKPEVGHKQMTVQILHLSENTNAQECKAELLEMEYKWIKILNTAFPFGLNDSIQRYGNISDNNVNPIDNKNQPYLVAPIKRKKRSHGIRKRTRKSSTFNTNDIMQYIDSNQNDIHKCYVLLRSLPKSVKKILLYDTMGSRSFSIGQLILLACVAKELSHNKREKPKNPYRWKIPFINRGIEQIKIETILKDSKLIHSLPSPPTKDISVTYTYNFPNRAHLCNYNKELRYLTNHRLKKLIEAPCSCKDYPNYVYQPLKHVITGDLNIIENEALRMIFKQGASYRATTKIDWLKNDKIIYEVIDQLINWLASNSKKAINEYTEFKNRFLQIYNFRKRTAASTNENKEKANPIPVGTLKQLHNKFIITVIDKASNNLVLICKKFYMEVICAELGIDHKNWTAKGNDIYKPTQDSREQIIRQHSHISEKFGVQLNISNSHLPSLYPIPKLHKNPYKFRFIAAGTTSSMKSISIILDKILKHMKSHMRNYAKKVFQTKRVNTWWSINSTAEFIERTKSIANNTKASIMTGDFASMFTALKQDTILKALNKLTDHCFKNALNNGCNKFINISHNTVYYSKTRTAGLLSYDKFEVMELIDQQVKNSFVTFADYTFKQTQGTSMGSNASCSIADCVLIWHEFEYLNKKDNTEIATIMNNSCRYVDDFCTFAKLDTEVIMKTLEKIYPTELKLEITSSNNITNFLDTTLSLSVDRLDIEVYNKTDAFPFKVIKYCSSGSLVHSTMGYKVFYGELHRFARISSHKEHFEKKIKETITEFRNNNYSHNLLIYKFIQFCTENRNLAAKFGLHIDNNLIRFTGSL